MAQQYVLVHGAFAGSWSWDQVTPVLEAAGKTVTTVDLPGRTGDPTPPSEITAQSYIDAVVKVLDAQDEAVVMVGHSAGGATISQAAEARPAKVSALVYVAAYLLRNGESVNGLAQTDADSQLGPNVEFDPVGLRLSIKPDAVKSVFLSGVPEPTLSQAAAKVQAEPGLPGNTPVQVSAEHFGRVPRYYVSTLQDLVVSPALQKKMYTDTPVEKVLTLESGHCPFASMPAELAAILLDL